MQPYPSRSDRRFARFEFRANKGIFTSEEILYNSEVKKLLKENFSVLKIADVKVKQSLSIYIVSWEHPYGTDVPPAVEEYIKGDRKYPSEHVKTIAQSLYVVAKKFSEQL